MNKTRVFLSLGLVATLGACVGMDGAQSSSAEADTFVGITTVYGTVQVIQPMNRRPMPFARGPVELRAAHVVLGSSGQPVAWAGGVPLTSCEGADAISRSTTDEDGRFEFASVGAGDYCVLALEHEKTMHLDGTEPSKGMDDFVIDLNLYSSTCSYLDPATSANATCLTRRDFIGATCNCQTSLTAYTSGTLVTDN